MKTTLIERLEAAVKFCEGLPASHTAYPAGQACREVIELLTSPSGVMGDAYARKLHLAMAPLIQIADAYDSNNLDDEARRYWGRNDEHENQTPFEQVELFSGRGGKQLLTLADCMVAREIVTGQKVTLPKIRLVNGVTIQQLAADLRDKLTDEDWEVLEAARMK